MNSSPPRPHSTDPHTSPLSLGEPSRPSKAIWGFQRIASEPLRPTPVLYQLYQQPNATNIFSDILFLVPEGLFHPHEWWLITQVISFHSGRITREADGNADCVLLPCASQQVFQYLTFRVFECFDGIPFVTTTWLQECVEFDCLQPPVSGDWRRALVDQDSGYCWYLEHTEAVTKRAKGYVLNRLLSFVAEQHSIIMPVLNPPSTTFEGSLWDNLDPNAESYEAHFGPLSERFSGEIPLLSPIRKASTSDDHETTTPACDEPDQVFGVAPDALFSANGLLVTHHFDAVSQHHSLSPLQLMTPGAAQRHEEFEGGANFLGLYTQTLPSAYQHIPPPPPGFEHVVPIPPESNPPTQVELPTQTTPPHTISPLQPLSQYEVHPDIPRDSDGDLPADSLVPPPDEVATDSLTPVSPSPSVSPIPVDKPKSPTNTKKQKRAKSHLELAYESLAPEEVVEVAESPVTVLRPGTLPLPPTDQPIPHSHRHSKQSAAADPAPSSVAVGAFGLILTDSSAPPVPQALPDDQHNVDTVQDTPKKKKTRNQLRAAAMRRKREEKAALGKEVSEDPAEILKQLVAELLPSAKRNNGWLVDCKCMSRTMLIVAEDLLHSVSIPHRRLIDNVLHSPETWSRAPCFRSRKGVNSGSPPTWEQMRALVDWDLGDHNVPVHSAIVDEYMAALAEIAEESNVLVANTKYFASLKVDWNDELDIAPAIEDSPFSALAIQHSDNFVFPVFYQDAWFAFLVDIESKGIVCYDPFRRYRAAEGGELKEVLWLIFKCAFRYQFGPSFNVFIVMPPTRVPPALAPLVIIQACELFALRGIDDDLIMNVVESLSDLIACDGEFENLHKQLIPMDRRIHIIDCPNWNTNSWQYCQGLACNRYGYTSCAPLQRTNNRFSVSIKDPHYTPKHIQLEAVKMGRELMLIDQSDNEAQEWQAKHPKPSLTLRVPNNRHHPVVDPQSLNPQEGMLNRAIMRVAWALVTGTLETSPSGECSHRCACKLFEEHGDEKREDVERTADDQCRSEKSQVK